MLTPRLPMSHPDGEITVYQDVFGRDQTSVDGPKGHVLVTVRRGASVYEVWHSDSIQTILSTGDFRRAVKTACVAVGLDPLTLAED